MYYIVILNNILYMFKSKKEKIQNMKRTFTVFVIDMTLGKKLSHLADLKFDTGNRDWYNNSDLHCHLLLTAVIRSYFYS